MDMLVAKIWYFFYFGGMVCVWPYLNLLYRANGLDDAQIGVLAAIKPWVSAPASFMWSGLADRFSIHKPLLLATFVASTLTRTSTAAAHSFVSFMVLAAAGELLAAPVGVMADAAVVAACSRDTDYGKSRLWGAVAWGGLSTFSGWMVSSYGMSAGFAAYLLLSTPCVLCAMNMTFKIGSQHQHQQRQQQVQKSTELVQLGKIQGDAEDIYLEGDLEQQPLVSHTDQLASISGTPWLQQQQQQQDPSTAHQQHHQQQQQQGSQLLSPEPAAPQGQQAVCTAGGCPQDMLGLAEPCRQQQQQRSLQIQAAQPGISNSSGGSSGGSSGDSSDSSTAGVDVLVLSDAAAAAAAAQPDLAQQQQEQSTHDQQRRPHIAKHGLQSPTKAGTSSPDAAAAADSGGGEQQQQQPVPPAFWRSLRLLLARPEVLIFMGQATSMGFGIGVIGEFLFLFLCDLGGSETLMGLTLTFTCLAEVPVFHFQGTVLRYISVHTMLHIVMWTYVIRLGLYALLPYAHTPWAVLPVELLHGITFACGWGAGTINCKRVAPPELAATMQGIFQGLYFGVGQGLGALIGGLLKQRYGGQAMFGLCSGIILLAWLAVVAAEQLFSSSSSSEGAGSVESVHGVKASTSSSSGSSGSGSTAHQAVQPSADGKALSLQRFQAWGQQLLLRLAGGPRAPWVASSNAVGPAQRKQLYMELSGKDSGQDLGLGLSNQQQQQQIGTELPR